MTLSNYLIASAEKRAAKELYNYAGAKLRLCQIEERLAEIHSQVEPLYSFADLPPNAALDDIKKAMQDIAFYVVVGRKRK